MERTNSLDCRATVPGDPQKVNVVAVNSTSVRVEWKPPAEKEQFGIIRGYQIHVQELDQKVISCLFEFGQFFN